MLEPRAPRAIHLETPNYLVRTMELSDVGPGWQEWLKDPETQRNLNARPETLSEDALKGYVTSFDRSNNHLLGIFEKTSGRMIGLRSVYINPQGRDYIVNVLIGESDARNKGARSETREVIYRYFFEDMDLDPAICSVVSTNAAILRVMDRNGWVREGSSRKPASSGEGFVELIRFRLARDVWRSHAAQA